MKCLIFKTMFKYVFFYFIDIVQQNLGRKTTTMFDI